MCAMITNVLIKAGLYQHETVSTHKCLEKKKGRRNKTKTFVNMKCTMADFVQFP